MDTFLLVTKKYMRQANSSVSEIFDPKARVPQGSVIALILFLIYEFDYQIWTHRYDNLLMTLSCATDRGPQKLFKIIWNHLWIVSQVEVKTWKVKKNPNNFNFVFIFSIRHFTDFNSCSIKFPSFCFVLCLVWFSVCMVQVA